MDLQFKSKQVFENYHKVAHHPKLTEFMWWFLELTGEAVVTSAWRRRPGIHNTDPLRALDLRSWLYNKPEKMADYINSKWSYDSLRPKLNVCIYHEVNKHGIHYHIQVSSYTVLREIVS